MPPRCSRRVKAEYFILGFSLGLLGAILVFSVFPLIAPAKPPRGYVKVGSVRVDGLRVDVYVNFTSVRGVPSLASIVAKTFYGYGRALGQGECYCSCIPVNATNITPAGP